MISQEQLSRFYCLIPPRNEQIRILEFINIQIDRVDRTILHVEKEIEIIQEYRTALISEVITGKIKVI